jgi:hypothetical protein
MSGELVRRLDFDGDAVYWDLRDQGGSPASAGIYLVLVETRDFEGGLGISLGRLVVLR